MVIEFCLAFASIINSPVSSGIDSNSVNTYIFSEYSSYDTESEIYIVNMDNEKIEQNIKKLKSFTELGDNWNGNGASSISESLKNKVENLLWKLPKQPDIFPTANGTIQIEYEKENGEYLEFEFFDNDAVHMFQIDKDKKELERDIAFDVDTIRNMVGEF